MSERERIEEELSAVAGIIDTSCVAVKRGEDIKLAGLDGRVDTICADISKLPDDVAKELKPRMVSMIDGLEKLVQSLTEQHGNLKTALNAVNSRKQATLAYGAGNTTAGPSNKKK